MIRVVIRCEESFRRKASYVFHTFLSTLGFEYTIGEDDKYSKGTIGIYYGPADSEDLSGFAVKILSSEEAIHYFQGKNVFQGEQVKFFERNGEKLPLLFYSKEFARQAQPAIVETGGTFTLSIDIIASAFFFLSCWQEWVVEERDTLGRFPFQASLQARLNIATQPVADDYMNLLRDLLVKTADTRHMNLPAKPLWPDGKNFAVCLTHDIDWVKKWHFFRLVNEIKHWLALVIKRRHPQAAMRRITRMIASLIKTPNPYWIFEDLIVREKVLGFRSSFFFIALRHREDGLYTLCERKMRELLRELTLHGFDIGLHGSLDSYDSPERLQEELTELQAISHDISGIRQHYLRLDTQKTFALQEKMGFRYDCTLGFAEHEGYRSGFSFPYFPYFIEEDRPFHLMEIPLVVMDHTLESYRFLDAQAGWEVLATLLERTRERGRCFTLLWHNSYFDDLDAPGFGEVYWRTLQWIHEHGGWGASGREIYDWWSLRCHLREEVCA